MQEVEAVEVKNDDTLVVPGRTGRVFSTKVLDKVTLFTCSNLKGEFFTVAVKDGETVTRKVFEV